jgi:predicted RNase H-like nuclease (RuvC/YqgF family)
MSWTQAAYLALDACWTVNAWHINICCHKLAVLTGLCDLHPANKVSAICAHSRKSSSIRVLQVCVQACLIYKCITGLEAELKHQEHVSSSQAAEVTVLKNAAAASEASCQALAEELQSAHEQLQHAQTQAAKLTAEHERLQQTCSEQTARCNQLEENLTGSSDTVSELQRQLQTETEALHAVQAELQGTVLCHAGIMSHSLSARWQCV